jgi:hypothetical protein
MLTVIHQDKKHTLRASFLIPPVYLDYGNKNFKIIGTRTVTEDDYVGASGLAMLNSEQDIEDVLAKIRANLEEGFETKKRIEAKNKG